MDKLKENDSRQYVCDDCINDCKQKVIACSTWEKNALEKKYGRILYMGVGRSGLVDENRIIAKAISKQVAQPPIIQGLGQMYCPVCKYSNANDFYCRRCGQKLK